MTIVGFVVSGTFVLLVCLRIACMRMLRRRNQSAAAAAAAAAADPAASGGRAGRSSELHGLGRGASQGLDPALIASFPMLKHSRDAAPATGKQDAQCVVCLGDYEEGDSLRRLPLCGHSFHVECIGSWLRSHATCPICRTSLLPPPEDKGAVSDGSGDDAAAQTGGNVRSSGAQVSATPLQSERSTSATSSQMVLLQSRAPQLPSAPAPLPQQRGDRPAEVRLAVTPGPPGADAEQLPWHYCRSFLALRRGGNSHRTQQPVATHLPPEAADTLPC
eukprot:SM000062S19882  [mRNA]  locus=s62:160810:162190:- [translate_table: standard]